jgi:hypothetical protein
MVSCSLLRKHRPLCLNPLPETTSAANRSPWRTSVFVRKRPPATILRQAFWKHEINACFMRILIDAKNFEIFCEPFDAVTRLTEQPAGERRPYSIQIRSFSFMCFLRSCFIQQIPRYRELCRSIGSFQSWNGALHLHSAHVTPGRIRRNPPEPGVTSTSGFFHSRRDVSPIMGRAMKLQIFDCRFAIDTGRCDSFAIFNLHTARSSNGSGRRSDKAETKVRLLFGLLINTSSRSSPECSPPCQGGDQGFKSPRGRSLTRPNKLIRVG